MKLKTYERYKLTHAIKYPLTFDMASYHETGYVPSQVKLPSHPVVDTCFSMVLFLLMTVDSSLSSQVLRPTQPVSGR